MSMTFTCILKKTLMISKDFDLQSFFRPPRQAIGGQRQKTKQIMRKHYQLPVQTEGDYKKLK